MASIVALANKSLRGFICKCIYYASKHPLYNQLF